MSDEQPKPHRKPWGRGAAVVTLAGGVVGYFVGVYICSRDGEGNNSGALGVVLGVPIGLIVGIGVYAIVKIGHRPDGRDGTTGEPDDEEPPTPRRFWSKAIVILALMLIAIFLLLNLAALIIGS